MTATSGGTFRKASVLDVSVNMLVQNNLITNSLTCALFDDGSLLSWQLARSLFERNWYWAYPAFMDDMYTARTFAQFTSLYPGQEMNATDGVNPNYVDRLAQNFRLGTGSPALTGGRAVHGIGGADGTTIPVGAYLTGSEVIGPDSTPVDNVAPQAPTDVTVQ